MIFITAYKRLIMSKEIVKLFAKTINKKWHLKRNNKEWQLSENDITIKFKVSNSNSLGFSLDTKPVKNVFGFFSDNPPQGVAKMCDGIIALEYKKQTYVFLIEQKSKYTDGYRKQIINGWYFCQWLFGLLKEYDYYSSEVKYIGLLCCVRSNTHKETSTHEEPQLNTDKHDINFSETNDKSIYLYNYLVALSKK